MRSVWIITIIIVCFSCSQHSHTVAAKIKIDVNWLDSIKQKSDTSWTKPYRNNEFVTAEYYVDRKDSIVTQIMKDSARTIRQINITKYDNIRLFYAEYYANGQLKAHLTMDSTGKYAGASEFYYEDGMIRSKGSFYHGLYTGEWKNYNEKGKLISTDQYDANGQLLRSVPAQ